MTMPTRDWRERNQRIAELLARRTGADVAAWLRRIATAGCGDEASLRAWLAERDVTGQPQALLVWECLGYPAFLLASAGELIDGQYRDRPALRPILDAVLARAASVGAVNLQARMTYLALLTPRRTFATLQPRTRRRLDLGLRLEDPPLAGRLGAPGGLGNRAMTARVGLTTVEAVDDEVEHWLRRAYEENRPSGG